MAGPVYQFGPFRLDPAERRLTSSGAPLSLTPKLFDMLVALVESKGHLVSKADLMARVWPDTVVEEANLAVSISALRKALGPEYIETVPKAGYRLGVPVTEVRAEPRSPARPGRRRAAAVLVAGVALSAVLLPWLARSRPPSGGPVVLAVLPLVDLGGDPEQDYFADGLTEEMIAQLGRLQPERLRVVARTSAMHYKGTTKRIDEIARELGVGYLLEGSVRRQAGRVQIRARLIDAGDQTTLWAETYDREAADVHGIQGEVAERVARSLAVALVPDPRRALARAPTTSAAAHEAYLRGRYHWNKRTPAAFDGARRYFEQAIEADPGYAAAYAGLADTYGLVGAYAYAAVPPREVMPKARQAAKRAIAIDDSLAEAHASLGWVTFIYEWDWAAAETEFRRAIELNPSYATARLWYSRYLAAMGRLDEAVAEVQRPTALDPVSPIISTRVGSHLYLSRRFEEAVLAHRKTLELEPDFAAAHLELGSCLLALGRPLEAAAEFQQSLRLFGDSTMPLGLLGRAWAEAGRRDEALRTLEQLRAASRQKYVPAYNVAMVHMGLADTERALEWLAKAFEERFYSLVFLNVDPAFDVLRGDPRMTDLAAQLRLPRAARAATSSH